MVPPHYSDYAEVFSFDLEMKLPKNTDINEHAIKFVEEKQLSYEPMYILSLMELETLKAYI